MATPRSLRSLPDVVTLAEPRPGTVVGLAPGSQLRLRLRSGLSHGRRRHARSDAVREVCELRIEVGEAERLAKAGRRSA